MVINRIVLRTMMKARYSEEPLGHYGLVMPEYAHFTSPIRRYADLSIHRILTDYVYSLDHEKLCRKYAAFSASAALQASNTELSAVRCERECENFYMAEYMKNHVNEEFDGMISGVSAGGVYVVLPNTIEGMVSVADHAHGRLRGTARRYPHRSDRRQRIYCWRQSSREVRQRERQRRVHRL